MCKEKNWTANDLGDSLQLIQARLMVAAITVLNPVTGHPEILLLEK